jgi:hypothetical protein
MMTTGFQTIRKEISLINKLPEFTGLFPNSSGHCLHAASLTSLGPSVPSTMPVLALCGQLNTRHSPPTPLSTVSVCTLMAATYCPSTARYHAVRTRSSGGYDSATAAAAREQSSTRTHRGRLAVHENRIDLYETALSNWRGERGFVR